MCTMIREVQMNSAAGDICRVCRVLVPVTNASSPLLASLLIAVDPTWLPPPYQLPDSPILSVSGRLGGVRTPRICGCGTGAEEGGAVKRPPKLFGTSYLQVIIQLTYYRLNGLKSKKKKMPRRLSSSSWTTPKKRKTG